MDRNQWWRRTAAGVCALGFAVGLTVAGTATAAAEPVDENKSYYNEPDFNPAIQGNRATQVLSLSMPKVGNRLVHVEAPDGFDSGNATANNGTVSLWDRVNHDAGRNVIVFNEQWEFIPTPDNTGKTITSGYGWLRNRASGKCLDVTGAPDPATTWFGPVAQYTCMNDLNHPNQLWTLVGVGDSPAAVTGDSSWQGRLKVKYSGSALAAWEEGYPDGTCTPPTGAGNRTRLTVAPRTAAAPLACDTVVATRETYLFMTNQFSDAINHKSYDRAQYACMDGWNFRSKNGGISHGLDTHNLSRGGGITATFHYENESKVLSADQAHLIDYYSRTGKIQEGDYPTSELGKFTDENGGWWDNVYQATLWCEPPGRWVQPG